LRVGSLAAARDGASASLLADGRVLVVGGNPNEPRIEIFDPATGQSSMTEIETHLPLRGHRATPLADGRVLLSGGGYTTDGRPIFGDYGSAESESYGPTSPTLTLEGTMHAQRRDHASTRLADGRVLVTGGENVNVGGFHFWRNVHGSAELFDPATRTFRSVASLVGRRWNHTATLLPDGRVLIVGGFDSSYEGAQIALSSMELFDPHTETFTAAGSMLRPRGQHTATLLPDGRVLLAGGSGGAEPTAEIYDPARGQVQATASVESRQRHIATVLRNGRVLLVGGTDTAVTFDPPTETIVETLPLGRSFFGAAAVPMDDGSVLLVGGLDPNDADHATGVYRYWPNQHPRRRAVRR